MGNSSQNNQAILKNIRHDLINPINAMIGYSELLLEAMGDGSDVAGSEGTTEIGTKLDLARAFSDMGDIDTARSILEEVITEGNPSQQQEAKILIGAL